MWHGARFFSQNDNGGGPNPAGPSTDSGKTNILWKKLQAAGARARSTPTACGSSSSGPVVAG
jgi:hypothetical protein